MPDSGMDRRRGLTDYEQRVMEYFAKMGASCTIEDVIGGIERHTFNVDALFEPTEDLYYDREDVETAVRNLVEKDQLAKNGAYYYVTIKAKIRHVSIYTEVQKTKLRRLSLGWERGKVITAISVIGGLASAISLVLIVL